MNNDVVIIQIGLMINNLRDLYTMFITNHQWYETLDSNYFWKLKYIHDYNYSYDKHNYDYVLDWKKTLFKV